jgi:hypothetical protein
MNPIIAEAAGCERDVRRAYRAGNITKQEKRDMLKRIEKVLASVPKEE